MAEGTKYHIWLHIEEEAPDGERFTEAHEPDKLATFTDEQEAKDFCARLHPAQGTPSPLPRPFRLGADEFADAERVAEAITDLVIDKWSDVLVKVEGGKVLLVGEDAVNGDDRRFRIVVEEVR